MSDWLGSHWRWRVAMVCIAVALLGYGWWQAERWVSRHLVNYGGSVAAYRVVHRDGSQLLEAFDWKTGRRWTLADISHERQRDEIEWSVRVSPDGKTIAWLHGSQVHTVDIESPVRHHVCEVSFWRPEYKLIGLSRDARFGVFQAGAVKRTLPNGQTKVELEFGWGGKQPAVCLLSVVDLQSGQVVSSRQWQSRMYEAEAVGDFRSSWVVASPDDPDEPLVGRWKLNDEGEWDLLERLPQFGAPSIPMVQEQAGAWRIVDDVSLLPQDTVVAQNWAVRMSDSGKQFTTLLMPRQPVFVGSLDTMRAWEIARDGDDVTGMFVTGDGANAVISNRRDDIVVFDVATGKVVATESSGSSRRNQLLAIGVGLLVLAALWARTAIAESKLPWGMFDALAATTLVQAAVFPIYLSIRIGEWAHFSDPFDFIPASVLRGVFVGSAIATGWYWAHGREWFATRWLLGTLWLIAITVSLVAHNHSWAVHYGLAMILRAWIIAGLSTAGLVAAVAVLFRPLGWSVRAAEEAHRPWRFGLMELFSLTASVAIALVLIQSLLEFRGLVNFLDIANWPSSSFLLGVPLVGVLFLRSRWTIALGIALVAVALAGTYWYVEHSTFSPVVMKSDRYIGEAVTAASTVFALVLPCLVLRRQGWRWTRTKPVVSPVEATA